MTAQVILVTAVQSTFLIQNAPRRCSTVTGPSGGHSTASTSKRISHQPTRCVRSHCAVILRIRAAFTAVTASDGSPYPVPERVFTSQTTRRSRLIVMLHR